jgi:hypothetical protein
MSAVQVFHYHLVTSTASRYRAATLYEADEVGGRLFR